MFSADRILTIRKSKGLSQELLAEQSGVSLRTIQRVEQGETVPRGHTVQALAAALGVALDELRTPPELLPARQPAPVGEIPTQELRAVPIDTASDFGKLRPDPEFVQLLNLSALSFLVVPFLNVVVPLLLWRRRRHTTLHVAAVGRRVLGFQVLWQVACFGAYLLMGLGQSFAKHFYQQVLPGGFLGVLLVSYVLNVGMICYSAMQLRRGNLDIYPFRL